ncbi:MAG: hypothetical protein IJJ33_21185 [Victivallales bacterium]|nr:hypothetical protein [Victivallales bacterium]
MPTEQKYDFRQRMRAFHQPGMRTRNAVRPGEIAIDDTWSILQQPDAPSQITLATTDLRDYLATSQKLPLRFTAETAPHQIAFRVSPPAQPQRGAFRATVSQDAVLITGDDLRGVLNGQIWLEDSMNLAGGPFLPQGSLRRTPRVKSRVIFSGSGIDDYPDWQLEAIRHAGFDTITVLVRGFDLNGLRQTCDFNDIIDRAEAHGLDTMLYNHLGAHVHPDAPEADTALDAVFGELFRRYPKAAGLHLVGESLEYPSKDPRTTGKSYRESVVDGIPDPRPSPGWFPGYDYPGLLRKIATAVHRVKPDAEVVFSTYNFCYLPVDVREAFLAKLPKDLTINIAFEMQKSRTVNGVCRPAMDYTVSVSEPGEYFTSEAEAAHRQGLHFRACTNTGGMSWDVGCVPYLPVPQLWAKRMEAVLPYIQKGDCASLFEGIHYGWWPNPAQDLGKLHYWQQEGGEQPAADDLLRAIAIRDYGTPEVAEVWAAWSEALPNRIVTSNEDQYGPLRVGPAYPFIFQVNLTRTLLPKVIPFPCEPGQMFGNSIVMTSYQPYESANQSAGIQRYPLDIQEMTELISLWETANDQLASLLPQMPAGRCRDNGKRLLALGRFIAAAFRTTLNTKRWWLLNRRLQLTGEPVQANALLDEMSEILSAEQRNVEGALPCVELDSRLGWEPSMGYVADSWHLHWKLRQLDFARREIDQYRDILSLK